MSEDTGAVVMLEMDEMARSKVAQEPDDSPKPLFSVKGRPSWHGWLKRYAESIGMDVLGAVDNALRQQAKRDEFPEPMPKRMSR